MRTIFTLVEEITEELEGAEDYISLALCYQQKDRTLADTYLTMGKEELGHVDRLHDQIVRLINKAKEDDNQEIPVGMTEIYEWQHNKMLEQKAKIKVMIESYK